MNKDKYVPSLDEKMDYLRKEGVKFIIPRENYEFFNSDKKEIDTLYQSKVKENNVGINKLFGKSYNKNNGYGL